MMSLTLANAGTAVLWLGALHLVVLNAVLGVIEGLMLAWWGRVPRRRAVLIMIVANYASAWIGVQFMWDLEAWAKLNSGEGPLLYHVEWAIAIMVAATFVMTVVLEMPLGLWTLRRAARPRWSRAIAVVVVNVVTYLGLCGVYLLASSMSVLKYERVRDGGVIAGDTGGWVYYIEADRRSLRRVRLDGSRKEKVAASEELVALAAKEGMWARTRPDGMVELCTNDSRSAAYETVMAAVERGHVGVSVSGDVLVTPDRFTGVDLRGEGQRKTWVWSEPSFGYGLSEWLRSADVRHDVLLRRLQLDTPFYRWDAQFPTILPGGQIVLEFGAHIMVMDDRRIGVLVKGVSPVVVLDAAE